MQNENANGKNFVLELLKAYRWIILGVLLLGVLSYLGFFIPTDDEDYRGRLSYAFYERLSPDSSSFDPGKEPDKIRPGERVQARLYIKNNGNGQVPPFDLELEELTTRVDLQQNKCFFEAIAPRETGKANVPIEFQVDSTYNYPYVVFRGKVVNVVKAGYVDEFLTRTPKDAVTIVMPVLIATNLSSNYWIGLSACNLNLSKTPANPQIPDTLTIALNVFNGTRQRRDSVQVKIRSVLVRKYGGPLVRDSTTVRKLSPLDRDSIWVGMMDPNGFAKPRSASEKFKFHVKMSPIQDDETICTYFEVELKEKQEVRKRISFGTEAIVRCP